MTSKSKTAFILLHMHSVLRMNFGLDNILTYNICLWYADYRFSGDEKHFRHRMARLTATPDQLHYMLLILTKSFTDAVAKLKIFYNDSLLFDDELCDIFHCDKQEDLTSLCPTPLSCMLDFCEYLPSYDI